MQDLKNQLTEIFGTDFKPFKKGECLKINVKSLDVTQMKQLTSLSDHGNYNVKLKRSGTGITAIFENIYLINPKTTKEEIKNKFIEELAYKKYPEMFCWYGSPARRLDDNLRDRTLWVKGFKAAVSVLNSGVLDNNEKN